MKSSNRLGLGGRKGYQDVVVCGRPRGSTEQWVAGPVRRVRAALAATPRRHLRFTCLLTKAQPIPCCAARRPDLGAGAGGKGGKRSWRGAAVGNGADGAVSCGPYWKRRPQSRHALLLHAPVPVGTRPRPPGAALGGQHSAGQRQPTRDVGRRARPYR